MLEGAFEPMVMFFFELTNSLAMFQAMMNDLLRDMIKTGKIVVFIDNVMIVTEIEEEYNKIVEVLRRMEKNDLFVKLEKYVWKIREVGFLGVIIGLHGVKMEKEKVQGVVDWPVPKSVKDV